MELNFSFVGKYLPMFFTGLQVTLYISLVAVVLATLLGMGVWFCKNAPFSIGRVRPLRLVTQFFIEIIRGTPSLLQILLAYVGIKTVLGLSVTPATAAIAAITLNSSVYVAEIIRAGIESVDKGQREAAQSLGMSALQSMWLVILPQAVRNILPAIGNEFVSIIKASSTAYVLGVGELLFTAKIVQGATYLSLEPLIVAAAFYIVLTFSLGRVMELAERRMKVSD